MLNIPAVSAGMSIAAVGAGGSAVTVNLGSLDFATIDSADLDFQMFQPIAGGTVSREVPMTVTFDGGTRSGDTAVGGSLVSAASLTATNHTETFGNSAAKPFRRGGTYCALLR